MDFQVAEPVEALASEIAAVGVPVSSTPTHTRARGADDVSYDEIAAKLLASNMLLTALELHFELSESGREIPRLRQFFSNPMNFEKALRGPGASDRRKSGETKRGQPGEQMTRSSSMATLDSLELARYSDDGSELGVPSNTAEERVIALEYELRKANDVIRNLREELTRVALNRRAGDDESSNSAVRSDDVLACSRTLPPIEYGEESESDGENTTVDSDAQQAIMAHEKRALNFLVNEYLLAQAFKLTSITLCEENASQDFDSWDDVGLNTPRPPDLLTLFRRSTKRERRTRPKRGRNRTVDSESDAHLPQAHTVPVVASAVLERRVEMNSIAVGTEDDSAPQAAPRACESCVIGVQVDDEETRAQLAQLEATLARLQNDLVKERQLSFLKATPLASCRNCEQTTKADDHHASSVPATTDDTDRDATDEMESTGFENETRTLSYLSPFQLALLRKLQPELSDWSKFHAELRDLFDGGRPDSSTKHVVLMRLVTKFVSSVASQNASGVQQQAQSGEPLTLANHEFVCLLLCAACLHPEARERDALLRALFTLTRRPDESVRRAVLTGCVLYAKLAGAKRIEEELFPQCCELMHNKFYEMRLLVVDASSILMPFLGAALCQSLVLSVLLGMFSSERQLDVRIALLNAFAQLTLFLDAHAVDKFEQLHSVFTSVVTDRSTDGGESLALIAQRNLLPALAYCCARFDILHSHLAEKLLATLDQTISAAILNTNTPAPVALPAPGGRPRSANQSASVSSEKVVLRLLKCVETLIPFLKCCVLKQAENVLLCTKPLTSNLDKPAQSDSCLPLDATQQQSNAPNDSSRRNSVIPPSTSAELAGTADVLVTHEEDSSHEQTQAAQPNANQAERENETATVTTNELQADGNTPTQIAVQSDSAAAVHHTENDESKPRDVVVNGHMLANTSAATNATACALDFDLTDVDLLSLRLIAATRESGDQLEELEAHFERAIRLFCAETNSGLSSRWPSLEWVLSSFVPEFLRVVGKVSFTWCDAVRSSCNVFQLFCRAIGREVAVSKIKYRFAEMFSVNGDDINTEIAQGRTSLTTPLVTVYACGFLLAYYDEANAKCLCDFLHSVLCTLALCGAPLDSICVTFLCLSKYSCCIEALLDTLWRAVTHSSAKLRCSAAQLFELLLKELDEALITQKVLPGLITLANDPDVSVRICTIPVLGSVIELVSSREVLEKCYMQLQSFLNDASHQHDHSLQLQLVRTIARVAPNAESRFCDAFVLPLAVLAAKNNQVIIANAPNSIVNLGTPAAPPGAVASQNAALERKKVMTVALLEAYTAVTCCVATLNEQLIHTAVLPGLRCLHKDILQVAAEHEAAILNLIRELEAKVNSKTSGLSLSVNLNSNPFESTPSSSSAAVNAASPHIGTQNTTLQSATPAANPPAEQITHANIPSVSTPSGQPTTSSRSAAVLNRLMDLTGKSSGGGLFKRNK